MTLLFLIKLSFKLNCIIYRSREYFWSDVDRGLQRWEDFYIFCPKMRWLEPNKNKTVLDRFQDSSKTGSGINCFPTFLAAIFPRIFCNLFCRLFCCIFCFLFCCLFFTFFRLFSAFLTTFFGLLFEYAVQMTCYFEYAVQKSGAILGVGGGGEGVCVCRSLS